VEDAGACKVHVRAATSYTALLFFATALCGILNITPHSLYLPGKRTPCAHWEKGRSGRFRRGEALSCGRESNLTRPNLHGGDM